MSLATNPPIFGYCTDNYASTPASAPGTVWTAGGNSTDGTAQACITAVAHDVHFLRVRLGGINTAGQDHNAAADILVDPAGGSSWTQTLINDLVCGMSPAVASGGLPWGYEFPVYIKAGSSIGVQGKTAHTADLAAGLCLVEAFGEPKNPAMWWCGSGVETLGISDAKGTAITPANSGAAGTWTSVGSTTARRLKAIQLGINGSDSNALAVSYHFEMGYGSNKIPGSSKVHCVLNTSEVGPHHNMGWIGCDIPIGTQMQVRGTCSGTAENIYAALYGVY